MSFDLDELCSFCEAAIRRFALNHQDEDFYAFAINGSWLCLNSEQEFTKKLKQCQQEGDYRLRPIARWEDLTEDDIRNSDFVLANHGVNRSDRAACLAAINEYRARLREEGVGYRNPADIKRLRENTGDWKYEGFADMVESGAFDEDAYMEHWEMSDEEQKTSEYGMAMDALVERLTMSGVFACLKTVPDFYATRVEHNY